MSEECWHHAEQIVCPKCGSAQEAVVAHTFPFWSYVHHCKCGYTIMESEWKRCGEHEPRTEKEEG